MKLCALVIGHKKASQGAVNKSSGKSEFKFNDYLSRDIEEKVKDVYVQRVYRRTYSTLPHDLNDLNPDFIISLHCNAYNRKTSGTEVLYYHRSDAGKQMAKVLQKNLVTALGLKNRGIKPKNAEDRGGYLLNNTESLCLISEPFFIDNNKDLAVASKKWRQLVNGYAKSIEEISSLLGQ